MKGNMFALDAPLPILAKQIKFFHPLEHVRPVFHQGSSLNNIFTIFGECGCGMAG